MLASCSKVPRTITTGWRSAPCCSGSAVKGLWNFRSAASGSGPRRWRVPRMVAQYWPFRLHYGIRFGVAFVRPPCKLTAVALHSTGLSLRRTLALNPTHCRV